MHSRGLLPLNGDPPTVNWFEGDVLYAFGTRLIFKGVDRGLLVFLWGDIPIYLGTVAASMNINNGVFTRIPHGQEKAKRKPCPD
jgi:hypothetical protein